MLENQDTVSESLNAGSQTHAGQSRVTPGELAHALSAIEARRQAEAAHLAGTIPIDDAVSELNLDASPDEIWTEVQAQRAQAMDVPQKTKLSRSQLLRGWPALIVPVAALWMVVSTVAANFSSHSKASTASTILSLSQVPSGTEVYADDAALAKIAAGKPLSQVSVHSALGHNQWRLVKIGAHVYLRGCIAGTDSLDSLQGKPLNVYNDDNSGEIFGEQVSDITVRLDKTPLAKSGGDPNYSEVTLPKFQPDSFTTLDQ